MLNIGPCTLLRLLFPCVIHAVSSGKANLQHKKLICYRCYLPVLTGFTESSLHRALTVNTTCMNTGQTKSNLGKEFDPTVADCGLQGTASSPSSTVHIYHPKNPILILSVCQYNGGSPEKKMPTNTTNKLTKKSENCYH